MEFIIVLIIACSMAGRAGDPNIKKDQAEKTEVTQVDPLK